MMQSVYGSSLVFSLCFLGQSKLDGVAGASYFKLANNTGYCGYNWPPIRQRRRLQAELWTLIRLAQFVVCAGLKMFGTEAPGSSRLEPLHDLLICAAV